MTKPKRQDLVYSYTRRRIQNALDLEYAIRASDAVSPAGMKDLRVLNDDIRTFWLDLGASPLQVDREELIDFAWDTLQVGFVLTRRHGRVYDPGLLRVVDRGLSTVRDEFEPRSHLLGIPAAKYYRVCDLLSGSDLRTLVGEVTQALRASSNYSKEDDVPLHEFRVSVREPIHLHPAFRYGYREEAGKMVFGFEVDLDGDFDLFNWRRQLNEFQYQYSLYRGSVKGTFEPVTRALTHEFLKMEHDGSQAEYGVPGLDSLLPILTGLYCWDRHKRDGITLSTAIEDAMSLYPASTSEENMTKNYKKAATRIQETASHFVKTST